MEWLIIASFSFMGAASPGPDFVVVTRNSVLYSRKAGLFTVAGISFGICVHMTYCILGIAAIIAQSVALFTAIKWLGAGYLIYIGVKALSSKGYANNATYTGSKDKAGMTAWVATRNGFLTNLLNPKATMFFLALFTQVIDPLTPLSVLVLYGATVVIVGGLWWLFVVTIFSDNRVKAKFLRFSQWIDRLTGGLLIALGVRLAVSKG